MSTWVDRVFGHGVCWCNKQSKGRQNIGHRDASVDLRSRNKDLSSLVDSEWTAIDHIGAVIFEIKATRTNFTLAGISKKAIVFKGSVALVKWRTGVITVKCKSCKNSIQIVGRWIITIVLYFHCFWPGRIEQTQDSLSLGTKHWHHTTICTIERVGWSQAYILVHCTLGCFQSIRAERAWTIIFRPIDSGRSQESLAIALVASVREEQSVPNVTPKKSFYHRDGKKRHSTYRQEKLSVLLHYHHHHYYFVCGCFVSLTFREVASVELFHGTDCQMRTPCWWLTTRTEDETS